MLSLPRLISAPELLRPVSIGRLPVWKNAILIAGSSSRGRRLAVRMRVSGQTNVVEMAGVDRFGIGDVVEENGGGEAQTILRKEWSSADFEATLNRSVYFLHFLLEFILIQGFFLMMKSRFKFKI